jgi:hypothetical protein
MSDETDVDQRTRALRLASLLQEHDIIWQEYKRTVDHNQQLKLLAWARACQAEFTALLAQPTKT